jgi:hypothetical protein
MMKPNTKPESLLAPFTKTPILICLGAAIAIHIVVIGVTSIPQLFGSGNGADREPAAAGEVEAVSETPAPSAPRRAPETVEPVEDAPERDLSDVERRVRDVAAPEEIPRSGDLLDIDLSDTN